MYETSANYEGAAAGGFLLVYMLVCLAVAVYCIVVNWKVFEKAGEDGWKSIIPIYNSYILYKISWGNGWMFLCSIIPVIGFVFPLITYYKMAKAFGKGIGFAIGLILVPVVFQSILAFGSDRYYGPAD